MVRVTPVLTSRKVLNITYQTPQETLLGTPETLPTSEPATPQVSYTIAGGDLPTLSFSVYSKKWTAFVFGAGKAITGATIYWRMKKNGTSVATGSSAVPANNYYTVGAYFLDVIVGDILEISLWSNQTDSNYDYKACQIQVTRIIVFEKTTLLKPCNFSTMGSHPILTLGSPTYAGPYGFYPQHLDLSLPAIGVPTNYESLYVKNIYGTYRIRRGDYDSNNADLMTSATSRPRYYRNWLAEQLILRGLRPD